MRTLLGLGDERGRELALKVAGYFDRYAPALPHLRDAAPGPHYHIIAYWGGYGTDPFGRFDTRIEAESFLGDAENGAGLREAGGCRVQPDAPRLQGGRGQAVTTTTRSRPRSLPSTTTKLSTEMGNLYVTVSTDEDGEPFEVFGWLGKGGSFQHGVTELACRLISLHLRRGTPVDEIVDQCRGIQEMQPFFNRLPDGGSIAVLGIGDGIAHVLKQYLKTKEDVKEAEAARAA